MATIFNEPAHTTYPIQEVLSILIVEDNTASRNLLMGMIGKVMTNNKGTSA